MRIALVSPYSWSYPGGVTRHIEALAGQLLADGHHVRVLAPFDPPDRRSERLHRGARPQDLPLPAHVIGLGRTIGIPANGAVSNLALTPSGVQRLRRELETGGFDVVNVHEPVAPALSWDAVGFSGAPLVGTFHTYGTNAVTHGAARAMGAARRMQALHGRIAVSQAAAWTAERFFGGHYAIVPNGVALPDVAPQRRAGVAGRLRVAFVGQAVERKGLPVLLRAFEGLRDHIDAELVIVGAVDDEVAPLLLDARGVRVLGRVDDAARTQVLRDADVLCAPSLGGESFGMVLTEAFAQGTPVVASDIAGYRDVVRDGRDGILVPRGDAVALAETLRALALAPERRADMGEQAAKHARRYSWSQVSREVLGVYEQAIAARRHAPLPAQTLAARTARRLVPAPADGRPLVAPRRLPSLEPAPAAGRLRARAGLIARRGAFVVAAAGTAGLTAVALQRIGVDQIAASLLRSSPAWVIAALAVMCTSMVLRALAWHAILRAALPDRPLTRRDAFQGTAIGVLMSATLPARLGEPARALIVARRAGSPRETTPVVIGTIVSQTVLNVLALVGLGAIAFSSVRIFDDHHGALAAVAVIPAVMLLTVLAIPVVLRAGDSERFGRLHALARPARAAMLQVRAGLRVFRTPRAAATATLAQFGAWGLQWLSCFLLLVALGLDTRAGMGAAAAILLAVNVTAAIPATPSNLGVFQAACVAVLAGAYGVSTADALGYGIVLQAVEIATAVVMGMPALLAEGVSWREVRLRALHSTPVRLKPLPAGASSGVLARRGERAAGA